MTKKPPSPVDARQQKNRDEFLERTRWKISKATGGLCSYPGCRAFTFGAKHDGTGILDIGVAAHICAAAEGGPRYDGDMSPAERRAAANGIWMCSDHARAIDADEKYHTVEMLRRWKREAEVEAFQRVTRQVSAAPVATQPVPSDICRAARADLEVLRNLPKWPSTNVALTLKIEDIGESVSTADLAAVALQLGDLILTAAPGMGKTTTLFQIAESVAANGNGVPLFISLGDWATEDKGLFDSILARATFDGVTDQALRTTINEGNVVLILDGWNELDSQARKRARVELERLKAELPRLALVISTRRQALDVPLTGKRVDLLPLSDLQQVAIAQALIGEAGVALLDRAWRTAGVRDLVPIPLYLTVLLSLREANFPETREELLRRFVLVHETDVARAEELERLAKGHHQQLLASLASTATRTGNTAISMTDARRALNASVSKLIADGQLGGPLDPGELITALVDNTMLVQSGDPFGVAFQHQQFQEWFASHEVAARMIVATTDSDARSALNAEIFNLPTWEESILFAVERMARGSGQDIIACAEGVIAAFAVDPMLAAEMIYRVTDSVWALVETRVMAWVQRWHVPGKADRALRFMLTSARPEFRDAVWPLITAADDQISLRALRSARRLRPALFGPDAAGQIRALPAPVRRVLVSELAMDGSIETLELATEVAMGDPDADVQIQAADSMSFRLANRQLTRLLEAAPDAVFDHIITRGFDLPKDIDETMQARVEAARQRFKAEATPLDRLRTIAYDYGCEPDLDELRTLIRTIDINGVQDPATGMIYHAYATQPQAVVDGLIDRLREHRSIFIGADDLLAGAKLAIEDDTLLEVILEANSRDIHAEASASVLGPVSAGRALDLAIEINKQLADRSKPYDKTQGDRRSALEIALGHFSAESLVTAVAQRSPVAGPDDIGYYASILARHDREEADRARPFSAQALETAQGLALKWAERLLEADNASRHVIGEVAGLMSRIADPKFLNPLCWMLDDNLRRLRESRAAAVASRWQDIEIASDARTTITEIYQRAFAAVEDPQVTKLMIGYLSDPDFGVPAARVLVEQWLSTHRPPGAHRLSGEPDFSPVREFRAARTENPLASTMEADEILAVAGRHLRDDGGNIGPAVALATIAAILPHDGHDELYRELIERAPFESRATLLLRLVLSGEAVAMKELERGIDDIFAAAQDKPWMLHESSAWRLRDWLRLLPFAEDLSRLVDIVMAIPPEHRRENRLEVICTGLAVSPSPQAAQTLFGLCEGIPTLYQNHAWSSAAFKFDSDFALQQLIELTAGWVGASAHYEWTLARNLAAGLAGHPAVRAALYDRLASSEATPGNRILASAIAELPDDAGILLLIDLELAWRVSLINLRTLEGLVTNQVPSPEFSNSYSVVPVPASELRCQLLHKTNDGGIDDRAAFALTLVDRIRDEHGRAIEEARHPDLGSGKAWPILANHVKAEASAA